MGGLQLIVTGDFFQLPPVSKSKNMETFTNFTNSSQNSSSSSGPRSTNYFTSKPHPYERVCDVIPTLSLPNSLLVYIFHNLYLFPNVPYLNRTFFQHLFHNIILNHIRNRHPPNINPNLALYHGKQVFSLFKMTKMKRKLKKRAIYFVFNRLCGMK